MGLDVGRVTIEYLERPEPPMYGLLLDLLLNPMAGINADYEEPWGGRWENNGLYEFRRSSLIRQAHGRAREVRLERVAKTSLLDWVSGLPWRTHNPAFGELRTMATRTVSQLGLLPFTDFEAVTPETELNGLNLNWREQELPEHQRTKHVHRLHPYLGKFVPQLVEIFLRKYWPAMVVDPFCGSGTTLVEAKVLGTDSFGCDISEFNCILSRVKTSDYDIELAETEILGALHESGHPPGRMLLEDHGTYETNPYLRQWFAPPALRELQRYRTAIEKYQYKDLLKVTLSRSARSARSARMTTHFDLDFPKKPQAEPYQCYKHGRICSPTQSARQFLKRYSLDTIKRIREFAQMKSGSGATVINGDSRDVQFPKADLVITSPPYVGLIDYHEQHRYAYELLGLRWNEAAEIGGAKRGVSKTAQAMYLDAIEQVFRNVKASLTDGARLVIIVHDRRDLYQTIAERLEFQVEVELRRHVNRRTGRRAGDFFESVFVWRSTSA